MLLKAFTGYKPPPDTSKASGPMAIEEFFKRMPKVAAPDDQNLAGLVAQEGLVKGRGFV